MLGVRVRVRVRVRVSVILRTGCFFSFLFWSYFLTSLGSVLLSSLRPKRRRFRSRPATLMFCRQKKQVSTHAQKKKFEIWVGSDWPELYNPNERFSTENRCRGQHQCWSKSKNYPVRNTTAGSCLTDQTAILPSRNWKNISQYENEGRKPFQS